MRNIIALLLWCFAAASATAGEELSTGQTLYLPVYSKIWYGDRLVDEKYPFDNLLSVLVSIRNTSLQTPIRVISAKYYSTEGKLINEYLPAPRVVNPMATLELYVERKEAQGGSGANFVIRWEASAPTNPPLVEAVHADIRNGLHAFVFTTTAQPIQPDK